MKQILPQEQNNTHRFLRLCCTGKLTRARTRVQALSHNHGKGLKASQSNVNGSNSCQATPGLGVWNSREMDCF